jgi:hypothetical protein
MNSTELYVEAKEDNYPRVGPFYYFQDQIVTPEHYQRKVNPVTYVREGYSESADPREHRDLWDGYMVANYPELKRDYDDDHKALPRGRVDYTTKGKKLNFFVTLDKCIRGKEDEIKDAFKLHRYDVSFSYGAMNYFCRSCGNH